MGITRHRIAVVLDGPPTPVWQQHALTHLASSAALELVDVKLAGARPRGSMRRVHGAIERHLFVPGPDALAPMHIEERKTGRAGLVVWLAEGAAPDQERRDVLYLRHERRAEPAEEAFRRAALRGVRCVATEVLLRGDGGRPVLVERTVSGARPFSTTLSRDKALWKIAALVCPVLGEVPQRRVRGAPAPGPSR